jgi:hypothetical protein
MEVIVPVVVCRHCYVYSGFTRVGGLCDPPPLPSRKLVNACLYSTSYQQPVCAALVGKTSGRRDSHSKYVCVVHTHSVWALVTMYWSSATVGLPRRPYLSPVSRRLGKPLLPPSAARRRIQPNKPPQHARYITQSIVSPSRCTSWLSLLSQQCCVLCASACCPARQHSHPSSIRQPHYVDQFGDAVFELDIGMASLGALTIGLTLAGWGVAVVRKPPPFRTRERQAAHTEVAIRDKISPEFFSL